MRSIRDSNPDVFRCFKPRFASVMVIFCSYLEISIKSPPSLSDRPALQRWVSFFVCYPNGKINKYLRAWVAAIQKGFPIDLLQISANEVPLPLELPSGHTHSRLPTTRLPHRKPRRLRRRFSKLRTTSPQIPMSGSRFSRYIQTNRFLSVRAVPRPH
jgi:hypothetical protein